MGKKKLSCFSAIKRTFTHNSKKKPINQESDHKKSSNENKNGRVIPKHRETKSFIPSFREPSSIEKILGEADHLFLRPPTSSEKIKMPLALLEQPTSPRFASASASPSASFSKTDAPKVTNHGKDINYVQRPELALKNQHLSATMIQAAYRGYRTRRSFRSLSGLGRLREALRGQNVKRQTATAMKQTQLFVRVQTQIQSRRNQMFEIQHQAYRNNSKEVKSTVSKWTQLSEAGKNEDWDDSFLTKEEVEARLRKKVEAAVKRERAMSYAHSHKLRKSNQKSAQKSPSDIRFNGYPRWWNWQEQQLPSSTTSQNQATTKNVTLISPMSISEYKPSPRLHANTYNHMTVSTFDNHETLTPRSSRSSIPIRAKQFQSTPTRTPQPSNTTSFTKYLKPRTSAENSDCDVPLKDDDSFTSCPPFSSPSYMTPPTVSAEAKTRANSNPKKRFVGTPDNDSKRRSSYPFTPNVDSSKWNKGSNSDTSSQRILGKHESSHSIVGRKPFNRFA